MKAKITFLTFIICVTSSASANVKFARVKSLVSQECKQTISDQETLRLVKSLYLTCIPQSKVKVSPECTLDCLKEAQEAVVGR